MAADLLKLEHYLGKLLRAGLRTLTHLAYFTVLAEHALKIAVSKENSA